MALDKRTARARYGQLRMGIDPAERRAWDALLVDHLTEFLRDVGGRATDAPTLAAYMPHRGEPDVAAALETLAQSGWTIAYPKAYATDRSLRFYRADAGDSKAFETGAIGIQEPVPATDARVAPEEIDIALVPGVAFGRDGLRLGYGGGYYDRWFALPKVHALRVGVAYDLLLCSDLRSAAHDVRMHSLVTESGVISCSQSR